MRRLIFLAPILAASSPLSAAESCVTLDTKAVSAMFDDWNFALSSLDASQVVQRYWPNAVLLPTVSNTPRTNAAMIGDYFEHFLAKRPRGRIDTRTVQSSCNFAMDMGTYTFSLMDSKGAVTEVAARYTFVYQYRDGAWKILHHHSSAMPEDNRADTAKPVVAEHTVPAPTPALASTAAPAPAETPARPKTADPKTADKDAPKVIARASTPAASPAPAPVKTPAKTPAPAAVPAPTPVAEARTTMFVNLVSSPPPSKFYPPEANKRKERGNVKLKVCADGDGAIIDTPEIVQSSGLKLLDEAAQSWARAAKWVPATLNNQRVEGCTQIDVAFGSTA